MTPASAPRADLHGLAVDVRLQRFVEEELLPLADIEPDPFWAGVADLIHDLAPRNRALLARRDELQRAIDDWHREQVGQPHDADAYEGFLREIGYLVPEVPDVGVDTTGVDAEIAELAGPQLVVPVTNARYAINAANARWGSLYDALYGTDALGDPPPAGPYDPARGARVVQWGRDLLDDAVPLDGGSHHDATGYTLADGALRVALTDARVVGLADPGQLVGHVGDATRPDAVLLRRNGLVIEVRIDPDHPVGRTDLAGIADLVLEAAVSTIMDCEDSVATVDVDDKLLAYRNWLGLLQGELTADMEKGGRRFVRELAPDRPYVAPDGTPGVLHGRSLLLVRNVGHHIDTDIVLDRDGAPIPETLLDAVVTVACALGDLAGTNRLRNSRTGSVYVVKPKLHGPEEVALADELFARVEALLGLAPHTVKLGIMDEERRTSTNLQQCIAAARHRVAFINTGFLDRTGDEIHTSMHAGPMVRKQDMRHADWITAYEDRNVAIGLACGLRGHAQIGKGMWAAPDRMAAMLEEKIGHPLAGASCAWVPSPTAATLHATHYHRVEVGTRQDELAGRAPAPLRQLLTIPVAAAPDWSDDERRAELENNAQGILGYVVRWVDQGVGCSKVPDIAGVALMEDRATCRISSQHLANWLHHGITTVEEVTDVLRRMAVVVDAQNADDPNYVPMAPGYDGPAFRAALDLVLQGVEEPSGYTERTLHEWRREHKRAAVTTAVTTQEA